VITNKHQQLSNIPYYYYMPLHLIHFYVYIINNLMLKSINGGELYIRNMTLEDSGEYKCFVRSVVGEISSTTTLFVDGPPGPPGNIITLPKQCNIICICSMYLQ